MKTPLFRYCLPTYPYKTSPSSRTKSYAPLSDYFFRRPRLVYSNSKTFKHFSRNQLRVLSVHRIASLRLTALSNFPGQTRLGEFKLVNSYKNFFLTTMFTAMFLDLTHQFYYSLYLVNVLASSTFLRHFKTPSLTQGVKAPSFKISQSAHKLLFL